MPYQQKTKNRVKQAGRGLGARLGKLAIKHGVSVQEIAEKTGASRTTVYSWISGGNVTNAYKPAILTLLEALQNR